MATASERYYRVRFHSFELDLHTRELTKREILVDYRPAAGIRVAPHFYTRDDELEQTVAEIQKIIGRK